MDTTTSPPAPPGAASQSSEDALDLLLRQIVTGYFVLTDGQGAISKWSEPAELLFGLEADEALMEPFFGTLVSAAGLSPVGEAWRTFLETGETPGATGKLRVDAKRPGGGDFAMEAVFVPVKLDEGFDFSLFLEDLGFELPIDMMLLRMRQQHPVVIRALRGALEVSQQPWEGIRPAGTLVAFRPLVETPWMDEAIRRREEEAEAAEAELQSRIEALDTAPGIQGDDVYDLEDARAVIDRLRWATERIGELEERSRISEDVQAQVVDARVRAESAERAALDARAEISGVLADRPVDPTDEAARLELITRMERLERASEDATEALADQRAAAEAERARAQELELQRTELLARLEQVEQIAGSSSVAEAAVADARAELTARMESLELSGAGGMQAAQAASTELVGRLEALERTRADEAAELRTEIERLRASDLRGEVEDLKDQVAEAHRLREDIVTLRERADAASGVMRRGEEREAAVVRENEATRSELAAALKRVEQLSEETARVRAQLEAAPAAEAGLSSEDRERLELAAQGVQETRTGLEAIRFLAEELRNQSAVLRDEDGRIQARLNELSDEDSQSRFEVEAVRREQDELRTGIEDLRREREEARNQLREAVRLAEEARTLAERGRTDSGTQPAPASMDEVLAARVRLDELAAQIEAAEARAEDARVEATAAREDLTEVREEARDAKRIAREAGDRVDMVDRADQNALSQISTQAAIIEEIGALSRAAQQDAAESRVDAGEARAVVGRLEQLVGNVREQVEAAVVEAAGAREQAAAASETADSVRGIVADVGEIARETAVSAVEPVSLDVIEMRAHLDAVNSAVDELRQASDADPELEAAIVSLRADVKSLRGALESAEGGDAAAVQAIASRLDVVEEANAAVPKGLDARMESLRDGLAGALGKLETVSVEVAASRTESGVGREAIEQRLADAAAELMAARTDAEQARRGLEGLREELTSLREYAAAAKAEASAAKEAAARVSKAGVGDDRQLFELRTEIQTALQKMQEYKTGFEEARQAAVAARRDAEHARSAAEKAGAVNDVTPERFAEVWQKMLAAAPQRPGSGVHQRPLSSRGATSKPKDPPPERAPRPGFDDDPRPMAVLDLKGKFRELNPGFTKLVGYAEHEFMKATWPSVLDRQTYHDQMDELSAMVAGDLDKTNVQATYMHGQGLMVLINGTVKLVRGSDGEAESLLLIADPSGASTH